MNAIADHFKEQAAFCELFGSPFTARLLERMGADLLAGGPLADLVGAWPTSPRADVLSLRLAGALHHAALSGRDGLLAAAYPAARPDWDMDQVWPAARAYLKREMAQVRAFIQSPPQTNETRRAIALLPGFLELAARFGLPLDLYEIGASAGLNLNWDRFAYRTQDWSWGAGEVVIDTQWSGRPPRLDASLQVRARAACDINPLNVRDAGERLQLRSYIWADQVDRLARFDTAVALALAQDVVVSRASAEIWLEQRLRDRAPGACAVVYHSVFYQYPPKEVREAIAGAIQAAGARATPESPLAWLRFEPESLWEERDIPARFLVDMITWPGGQREKIAIGDPHGRFVEMLP